MPLYRWQSGTIAQVESVPSATGKSFASVLRLKEGADAKLLSDMRAAFAERQMESFIRSDKDGDVLVIPESKKPQQVIDLVSHHGWTGGAPQVIATAKDKANAQKKSSGSILKEHALMTASILYNIGAATWIISGIQRGRHNRDGKFTKNDWSEIMVGVMNGVGSVMLSLFGEGKKKHPMLAFEDELKKYLKEQGVIFPSAKDATPESIHKSGVFDSVHRFLSKNGVSALSLSKGTAATFVAYSASKKTSYNGWKMASGMVYAAAWFATFALDKPHAPPYQFKSKTDPARENAAMHLYHWASENPRGHIAAPIGVLTQAAKIWGATKEGMRTTRAVREASAADFAYAKGRQYDFVWNILGCCAFFLGNFMFGVSGSKKGAGKDSPEGLERDLLTVSANTLAAVPEKARSEAIRQTAEYMASVKGVSHSQEEIEKAIADQVEHLRTLAPAPGRAM